MFNKVHALLLAGARIWPPPIRRRRTGGIAAGLPTAKRRDVRRNYRQISVAHPAELPAKLPGKLRASSGQMPGNCWTVSGHSPGRWAGSCRRNADGQSPVSRAQLPGNLLLSSSRMPGSDPNLIREAAAQFQPRRRPRFQNLQSCCDVIIELREKGASYEAIAELLTRYGVKTSRTMVNEFVHTLSQPKGGRRRKSPLKPVMPTATPPPATLPPGTSKTVPATPEPIASAPIKIRGPHIAKVELLKPGEKYD